MALIFFSPWSIGSRRQPIHPDGSNDLEWPWNSRREENFFQADLRTYARAVWYTIRPKLEWGHIWGGHDLELRGQRSKNLEPPTSAHRLSEKPTKFYMVIKLYEMIFVHGRTCLLPWPFFWVKRMLTRDLLGRNLLHYTVVSASPVWRPKAIDRPTHRI